MRLSPRQRAVLSEIAKASGPVTIYEIADGVYADDADGGPVEFANVIRVLVHRLRSAGIEIERAGRGRASKGYRVAERARPMVESILAETASSNTNR